MSALLHHSIITATGAIGSTAAADYPHDNILSPAARKRWVADAAGAAQVFLDFSAPVSNCVAVAAQYLTSGNVRVRYISGGGTTSYGYDAVPMDRHGIRRMSRAVSGITFDSIGVNCDASPTDTPTFEVGAMYAFAQTLTLPDDPLYGSRVRYVYPEAADNLPNGANVSADTGARYAIIELDFAPSAAEDVEEIYRLARAGICWLDLGIPDQRHLQWPVRAFGNEHTRQLQINADRLTLRFKEVT